FPTTNLYELESRVFTDHWSIPYKREESLGKCLIASTCLARHGLAEADENCKRFMDRCMPEAFKKLLTSSAVHKWGTEIHEGIYNMLMLLVELVAERVKQDPVPVNLMGVLTMAFNPDNEYHFKNRMKTCQRNWAEVFGDEANMFAVSPSNSYQKRPHGWLVDLVNRFGELGGFTAIQAKLNADEIEIANVSALVQPLGVGAEYLNSSLVQPMLDPVIHKMITYVQNLEEKDLKDKVGFFRGHSLPGLCTSIKLLCMRFQRDLVTVVDDLRLDTLLRMLKTPHFSTKMNSLKEVTKLIEESTVSKTVKNAIDTDKLLDWLVENSVLSIALEGNIDQAQYCERIKGIIELLGSKLSLDELSKIWRIQAGQSSTVIENIHTIIAAAAVKFSFDQLTHLFVLIQKSWEVESDRVRQKLLSLIGRIGREARSETTTGKVLEVLWELASHLLPHVQQALEEHLGILSDAYAVKETVKRSYIIKCIEDIKKAVWVVPALRQLHEITRSFIKQTYQKQDKVNNAQAWRTIVGVVHHSIIQDLKKNFEIVKLITGSLVCCHRLAVTAGGNNGLSGSTLVDGRYTYQEYLDSHLRFLAFFLQEASLYLVWNRAKELWECLVSGPDVCELDREMCFEWFTKGQHDLESDVQQQLFKEKILKLEPYEITMNGFNLFKTFFENVNLCDHRLKRQGTQLCVERLDLAGMDFIWRIAMESPDEEIANEAIQLIITYSYTNLNPKMKKDSVSLHKKFIADCYKRLEVSRSDLAVCPFKTSSVFLRSTKLVIIERLLLLAERYVITIEDMYSVPRTILPHGASFNGHPVTLHITYESTKDTFTLELQTHSNDTIGSIRWKIAEHLSCPVDNVQIFANDSVLTMNRDQKLLSQLGFSDEQSLTVKSSGTGTPSGSSESSASASSSSSSAVFNSAYALEQVPAREKSLPGVVMALVCNVFEMLYQLANLDESSSRITLRVRNLLLLIPTDPEVQDALDNFVPKESSVWSHQLISSAPGMSTFRVLYNLEVLSSKLMPTSDDEMAKTSSKSFCENFLRAGGLSLVVNVMQRDSIPAEVDYETRQGVYSICLQLARFRTHTYTHTNGWCDFVLKTPEKSSYRQMSLSERSSIRVEEIIPAARVAIQVLRTKRVGLRRLDDSSASSAPDCSTVACFMRLTWAAAAGRLDLVGSPQPIKETHSSLLPQGVRTRQSVSIKDAIIAREALSLLVTCLQLRCQQLSSFYNLPSVNDFIIDILLGSPGEEIRRVACDQLYTLSQSDTSAFPDVQKPNLFLLSVILTAQVGTAGDEHGRNCTEYFDLRCQLLDDLTTSEMEVINVSPAIMLEDEISWLDNFEPSWSAEMETSEADNVLLAGHLRLIKTLLSLCGNEKEHLGPSLIQQLLDDFLFRASRIIINSSNPTPSPAPSHDFHPKCNTASSRLAAYEVLLMLGDSSLSNLRLITRELLFMHHQSDPSLCKEFDYLPPVESRAASGFVGLKNGGATCYMNAVFQQLYMQPGLAEPLLPVDTRGPGTSSTVYQTSRNTDSFQAFLSIEDDTDQPEESVFYQVQSLFGHLMESKLQYYVPENFWKIFKMWNRELYVREQQDAYEFFTSLVDQLDEYLKKMGREQIFKNTFQGIFSDQKICKDCPHRYEREETFMALNLGVTSCQSLEISLDQFVRGEVLEGSNAYYCEKCKEKRTTVKRTCIKSLPSVLCIHLMRFGFDWESGRSIKYDEQIRFPWVLNMEPYTVAGMARQDCSGEGGEGRAEGSSGGSPRKKVTISENYELVGVVVHSGQAHAGHYYSFIKDRRGSARGRWYKFNDTVVEEFDMNDETLEYECFGGEYRPKVYDQSNPYPDVRRRYWNAYMLFYQKISDQNSPVLPKKSRVSIMSRSIHHENKMPASIYQMVRDENLRFMKNRDVYNSDYFNFTLSLASVNATKLKHPHYQPMAKESLQLAVHFLFHTYLHTKKKLRVDTEEWMATVEVLLSKSCEACQWMVQYLVSPEGREITRVCLLECGVREVRVVVASILEKTLESALQFGDPGLDNLTDALLSLLDKDVPENVKNCAQYFGLFSNFAQRNRRWSSAQAREFLHLHSTLALITLHSDLAPQQTHGEPQLHICLDLMVFCVSWLLSLSLQHREDSNYKWTALPSRGWAAESAGGVPPIHVPLVSVILLQVMFAMRELSGPLSLLIEMVTYSSYCNESFSLGVLQLLKTQLETAPPHELKNVFQMLQELLVMEDPLQAQRLKYAFESDKGLLALMHQSNNVDSRRCYQCVKFLVTLAQKCSPAKDYFKDLSGHWSWAVQWL
uniref:ubiquitinyl hydrolase 1 n=1 Tax=Tetraodon nigroviridis TaxID=99883 RepID=H3DJS3_TETNG